MAHATLTVDNPFTLGTACTVPLAGEAQIDALLDRAKAAARVARETLVAERVRLCERATEAMIARADDVAREITAMMGKPLAQAKNEVQGMAVRARYMASIAEESLADIVPRREAGFERRIVKEPL